MSTKDHNRLVSQTGVAYIAFLAGKYRCLFRNILEHDKGIDAEIEITESLGTISSIIGLQVKSRSDCIIDSKNRISIQVSDQNLVYWQNYGRPVLLMVYTDDPREVYWTRVDKEKSQLIKVDTKKKFDENSISEFKQIILEFYADISRSFPTRNINAILGEVGETVDDVIAPIKEKLEIAENYIKDYDFQNALKIYDTLFSFYPAKHIKINLAYCLLGIHEFDRAYEIITQLEKNDNTNTVLLLKAFYLAHKGEYLQAQSILINITVKEPAYSEAWSGLGLTHLWQGNYEQAKVYFLRAVEFDKENESIIFNLALCAMETGDYKQALDYYNQTINIKPNFYDGFNNKGTLLYKAFCETESLNCYNKAIELRPDDFRAWYNSACLLKDLGENNEALRRFEVAKNFRPNDPSIKLNIGLLYARLGEFKKANSHISFISNQVEFYPKPSDRKNLIGIIDIGYKVMYLVTLEVLPGGLQISSIEEGHHLAVYNAKKLGEYVKVTREQVDCKFD